MFESRYKRYSSSGPSIVPVARYSACENLAHMKLQWCTHVKTIQFKDLFSFKAQVDRLVTGEI